MLLNVFNALSMLEVQDLFQVSDATNFKYKSATVTGCLWGCKMLSFASDSFISIDLGSDEYFLVLENGLTVVLPGFVVNQTY